MDAIVTDVHLRAAVAGVRGLGRAGVRVLALSPQRAAAGRWSRYAAGRATGPAPEHAPAAFARRVGELAEEHGPLVAYPGCEAALDALLGASLPAAARLPYGDPAALARLRDKRTLASLATSAGLAAPRTIAEGPVGELAGTRLPTPLALKPARPGGELGSTRIARSADELAALLGSLPPDEELLAQEPVRGALTSVALVLAPDGTLAERFQQRAERTWPADAGASSVATSMEPDHELVRRAAALLREAGYWGLAQLQFLEGERGPALVDVNPRFYGSLPLALACGANLPAAWHAVVNGREAEPSRYRAGVSYRWLEADLTAALRGNPRRLLYRSPRPAAGAFWASDDALPAALLARSALAVRLRRRVPGGGGS